MDHPVQEEGETSVHEYEESEGKRRRLKKRRSVVAWIDDAKSDTDSADILADGELVIRLSNTRRRIDDPLLKDHDCIAAEGNTGRLLTLDDISYELTNLRRQQQRHEQELRQLKAPFPFIAQGLSEPLVCAEAFKLLERDFTEILKDLCHMAENEDLVEDATEIVTAVAKRQNWPISSSGWVESISFGVFAEAVLMVNRADIEGMGVRKKDKKRLCNLKDKLTDLFWDALEGGISALEEDDHYSEGVDPEIEGAIAFLKNKVNLLEILKEWVANSHLRTTRNSISHPFSSAATKDVKAAALKFYDIILTSTYSEKFRHVGELGKLKVRMVTRPSAKQGTGRVGEDYIMKALLAFCASGDEGTDTEEDDSDSIISD